jgi:hypothetical protein
MTPNFPLPTANATAGPAAATESPPTTSTQVVTVAGTGGFVQSTGTSNASINAAYAASSVPIAYQESSFAVLVFLAAVVTLFG